MNKIFYNNKRLLLCSLLAVCSNFIFAQSVLKYDANSPEVGSLLRVSDMITNLYTGLPDISVPLYSIKLKDYSYDIQLCYNAEGNKPDVPVSNVGLGWSLTGGQIYRKVNGELDEFYTFSEYADRTEMPDWNQKENLDRYYLRSGSNEDSYHEPELDEFVVNIGAINASFYMYEGKDGKIVTKIASKNNSYFEVTNIRIGEMPEFFLAEGEIYNSHLDKTFHPQVNIRPRPKQIIEITITDSNGIKYIFGGGVETIDLSCDYLQDSEYPKAFDLYGNRRMNSDGLYIYPNVSWESYHSCLLGTASTWHIKEITLPDGESLKFTYSKGNVNIMERLNIYKSLSATYLLEPVFSSTIYRFMNNVPSTVNPQYYLIADKLYDIVYPSSLKSIRASNGDFVEFVLSQRNDLPTDGFYDQQELFLKDNYGGAIGAIKEKCHFFKLDKIKTKTDTVDFYYTEESTRRLNLDSLMINKNEKYRFVYNPLLLPRCNQMETDNWGYYNGKSYNGKVSEGSFADLYDFRQPDSLYAKAEILEGIVFPTGGKVAFQYELHDYSKIAMQYPFEIQTHTGMAGGLRIKKIAYYDDKTAQPCRTKEFLYQNEDGSSSGILSVVPIYKVSGTCGFDYDGSGMHIHGTFEYDTQSDTRVNWTDQFHIGYSRVSELLSDSSKTVYSFVNHERIKDEPSVGELSSGIGADLCNKYTSRKLDRGLLNSVEYYGPTEKLFKREVFEYHSDLSDYLKTIERYSFRGTHPIRVSANKIYTYFPFLKKKETTLYTDCDSIYETEIYEYNDYRLLTSTKKFANRQWSIPVMETHIQYLSDLMGEYNHTFSSAIPPDSPLKVYDEMRRKRLLNYPIETVVKRDEKVVAATIMTYKLSDTFMVPEKEFKLETDVPLDDYSSFKLITSDECSIDKRCVVETEFLDYDSHCNPTNIVDRFQVNTAYLWEEKEHYPIARVVNARNTFKSVLRYKEVIKSEYISLGNATLTDLPQTYKFSSSSGGTVVLLLEGQLGYNWFLQLKVDNQIVHLVQNRSYNSAGAPWDTYAKVYTSRQELYLPAGSHELTIRSARAYNSTSSSDYVGYMLLSYLAKESIEPEISGSDDFFYENFENNYYGGASFGHHSKKSYIGAYEVNVAVDSEKEYFMDYQVFKDGKWNYKKLDFINGCDTIDEGQYPIDNVRVYPKKAFITTYDYFPLVGLRGKTDERGLSEFYQYDSSGRLTAIRDNDTNIIEKYEYSNQDLLPETLYYNHEIRNTFIRNNCDTSLGEMGRPIDYIVPAKRYSSTQSQEDANQKAYADLLNNGQQYANENGECSTNIILSVYNPHDTPYILEFCWGTLFNMRYGKLTIPPSEKIADTGDILKDYKSATLYLPRENYRNVVAYPEDNYHANTDLSVKSSEYNNDLFYRIEDYPDFQDIYVIGKYTFSR